MEVLEPFSGAQEDYDRLDLCPEGNLVTARMETRCGPVCPSCQEWLPGDVLLFDRQPGLIGTTFGVATQIYQAITRPTTAEDHRWVHAALYVGNCTIWELTPGRMVIPRLLRDCLAHRAIKVRRLKNVTVEPSRLISAINELAPMLYFNIQSGGTDQCSTFARAALEIATSSRVLERILWPLPADFDRCDAFETVRSRWQRFQLKS